MKKTLYKAERLVDSKTHLTFTKHNAPEKPETHLHDYYELELVLSGEGEQNLNGSVYPLKAGSFYLVTPIDFHCVIPKPQLTIANISFDETLISPEWQLYFMNRRADLFFNCGGEEKQHLEALFSLMEKESRSKDGYAHSARQQLLELLFITIARKSTPNEIGTPLTVQRSMQYIFRHFRDGLTLSQIAAESGYTPHYFSALFHKETGRRLTDFLTELRLNYAKMLLSTTDLSITEICEKSGFGSQSNFFRLFSQHLGCTPVQYRKNK